MTIVPMPEWRPDRPDLVDNATSVALNVLPRTDSSYGPMPSLAVYSGALTARCQGAVGVSDTSGNTYAFAGDATKLYKAVAGSTSWSNVSKSGGYSIASDQFWKPAFWTPNQVLMTDFSDAVQSFVIGTSTLFADLAAGGVLALSVTGGTGYTNGTNYALTASGGAGSGFAGLVDVVANALTNVRITAPGSGYTSIPTVAVPGGAGAGSGGSITVTSIATIAPKARYLAVVRDFIMLFNIFDATDGLRPTRAHWCGIGAPPSWPVAGTAAAQAVQSDFQDINAGDFGQGTGIVSGLESADAALFFERGVVRSGYVGPPAIFGFYPVEGARGCSVPGSIAQLGNFVIYLGPDDLYSFDGAVSTPLGAQKFAKTFYADVDQSKLFRISAAFDPINKIYFMAYPSANNVNGNPNKILAYHWHLQRASLIDAAGDVEILFRSLSFGLTLEQLDTISTNIETLPFSLDSRTYTGGALLLSAFDSNHKLNYFTGPALAPTVDTSEAQLLPSRRAFVNSVRPLVDGGAPSVAVATRERQVDAKVYGAAVAMNAVGECPQRASGRYMTARITMAAGDSWSQIFGIDISEDAVSDDGDR